MNTIKINKELLLDPSNKVVLKVGIKILKNMYTFFMFIIPGSTRFSEK
jgi:hypothetical protein